MRCSLPRLALELVAFPKNPEDRQADERLRWLRRFGVEEYSESIRRLFEKWRSQFPVPRKISFSAPTLDNPYCKDCRLCCGPQPEEQPFPMALLDSQIGPQTIDRFYMLDEHTASLDRRGCKALGACGCQLERGDRPPACNLFPFVIVDMRLYLYRVCPASMLSSKEEITASAGRASEWINSLPAADVRRISISRSPEDLKEKYLDLGISVTGL